VISSHVDEIIGEFYDHLVVTVMVSIGVAMVSTDIDQVETFIARRDQAMYHAKRRGRNRVELYNEESASKAQPK
jgi:diguanylate cyclase (GGDEF)-like protein